MFNFLGEPLIVGPVLLVSQEHSNLVSFSTAHDVVTNSAAGTGVLQGVTLRKSPCLKILMLCTNDNP